MIRFRRMSTLSMAALALLLASPIHSEELNQPMSFHGDWLGVRSISMIADLEGDEAVVEVVYQLVNASEQPARAEVKIGEPYEEGTAAGTARSIKPGEAVEIAEVLRYPIRGQGLRGVRIDAGLRIDGAPAVARPEEITVQLKLPHGVTNLVSSSLPFERGATRDGRSVASFQASNLYLRPLVLKWHRTFNLSVSKTGSVEGRSAEVEVRITNAGPGSLAAFTVSDDFPPGFVESGAPDSEFELVRGQENDVRLVWSRNLPGLAPGETANFKYSLKLRIDPPAGLTFGGTRVNEDATGDLVGASEPFQLGG